MYPIALHLQGKKCIVFGAGKVAQRRVWGLLESGAEVTVAAPEPMPACWKNAKLTYLQQPYAPELLGENLLVFAATDDSAENARIVREAQAAGKLASSATVSPDCTPDFAVPAHRKHGDITMAVTTEGDAPSLAGAICRELEPKLAEYSELCTCLGILRRAWKETMPDEIRRMQLLRILTEPKALELFREKGKGAYLAYASSLTEEQLPACRNALLMVSFGTSYADTREQTIGAELIMHAIPYPMILVLRFETEIQLWVSHQRNSQNDKDKNVLEDLLGTKWLQAADLADILPFEQFKRANCYVFYSEVVDAISRFNVKDYSQQNLSGEEARLLLKKEMEKEVKLTKLRAQLKKETQFNKRVEISMQIRKVEKE